MSEIQDLAFWKERTQQLSVAMDKIIESENDLHEKLGLAERKLAVAMETLNAEQQHAGQIIVCGRQGPTVTASDYAARVRVRLAAALAKIEAMK